MSRSPNFFVERYNKETKQYELEHPLIWSYNHTARIAADLFPYNGAHEMFSIVEKDSYYPEMHGIHEGLPPNVCEEIQERYDYSCWGNYSPKVRWFTYADMYIYFINNPEVKSMEEEGKMVFNPIKLLKERVDAFMEVVESYDWRDDWSLIRIVYWIS